MKKTILLCMVSVLLIFTACSAKSGNGQETAEKFLQAVFDVSEDDVTEFMSVETEEDLNNWVSDRYGEYLTDDGMVSAMQNRMVAAGIEMKNMGKEYKDPKITVEKRKNAGDENWMNYQVSFSSEDLELTYSGSMLLVQQDKKWKIEKIMRNN